MSRSFAPGLIIVVLGEASFHHLRGGTTTNQPDIAERPAHLISYREHYEQLRGRPFRGPRPFEAIQAILKDRRDFAADHRPERFRIDLQPARVP